MLLSTGSGNKRGTLLSGFFALLTYSLPDYYYYGKSFSPEYMHIMQAEIKEKV